MQDIFPSDVRILTGPPTVALIAQSAIDWAGVREMARWVKAHRPECLPEDYDPDDPDIANIYRTPELALFPHRGLRDPMDEPHCENWLTDNELLVELAGRKCYDSFGLKAGQKTNAAYIAHIMGGVDRTPEQIARAVLDGSHDESALEANLADALRAERDRVPHASVLYHAKMTFFFGGLSRRVSQELMRNYVGANRDHEGSPSQESTRFTYHYGTFVAPPYLEDAPEPEGALAEFTDACRQGYAAYRRFVEGEIAIYEKTFGQKPKGIDRKRILEASIGVMPWNFETSFIWTTNPGALTKLLVERDNPAADAEFCRFARVLKGVCLRHAPNLFPRFAAERAQAGGRP
jgi:thymidylate synthase ThyX